MLRPEIVEYPDSNKFSASAIQPGSATGFRQLGAVAPAVDYWHGENQCPESEIRAIGRAAMGMIARRRAGQIRPVSAQPPGRAIITIWSNLNGTYF